MLDQYLKVLEKDLKFYKASIKEVSEDIIKEGFSKYPIFIASVFHTELGELILDGQEMGRTFSIMASTLEEMVEKTIIPLDKKAFFEQSFKPAESYACILMLTSETQQFIFYPYTGESIPTAAKDE